ncbi:FAD/NAD(P)-binding oxidoreductase [Pseudomonas sp. SLFW]|uniref:NAD(P)/FAD-dependent oxidoreductase n=1 Tax=Pseudomonas sp. SLFW TaxID=2683259 RepID=UPI0014120EA3|nr:FAD/NAD(P)-binding oxidoreductase [Pseudomonas sp. SLFW]
MSAVSVEHAKDLAGFYDVIVVGAGPAGMSAATLLAAEGVSVLVLDENPAPGGQIYRAITRNTPARRGYLGEAYWAGQPIAEGFLRSPLTYAARCRVWSLDSANPEADEPYARVGVSLGGVARHIQARKVILATGALERPMPLPGWTLPGVMTAGAAQIALKTSGLVPAGRVVLAGCGPLLYQLAVQLHDAGANVVALLDTGAGLRSAWRYLPEFVFSPYALKGLALLARARRHLRVIGGVTRLDIIGEDRATGIRYQTAKTADTLAADVVLLHQGVIPDTALANSAGCALMWNGAIRAFQPRIDAQGCSSLPDIFIAGDGAGIAGALASAEAGRAVALAVLLDSTRVDARSLEQRRQHSLDLCGRWQRGRHFIDAAYLPMRSFLVPQDDSTLVCRCEEVTAGTVRDAARLGLTGPNQLKVFTRCGMGPCQGRLCGPTVVEVLADEWSARPADVGTYRLRPPIKPLRLGEIAALSHTENDTHAVTGLWPEKSDTPSYLERETLNDH